MSYETYYPTDAPTPPRGPLVEVWMEGYRATGDSARAKLHGTYKAENLEQAVRQWVTEGRGDARMRHMNWEALTFWGCRFFDNEADARETFG